jgi:SAM-dependent methyltransferase
LYLGQGLLETGHWLLYLGDWRLISGTIDLEDPKRIVARGYDAITQNYLRLIENMGLRVREKYLTIIEQSLPKGALALELGCGAGMPMTRRLSLHCRVIGLDISKEQLALAVRNVPEADFVLADMTRLPFPEAMFDAVIAFYSITHVPRDEHLTLLGNIYRMLRLGGLLVATTGYGDSPDVIEPDWLGASMFFSHYDGETNVRLAKEAGFNILSFEDEFEQEYGSPVCFRWIVARR